MTLSRVKWPPTRGSKGHFESTEGFCLTILEILLFMLDIHRQKTRGSKEAWSKDTWWICERAGGSLTGTVWTAGRGSLQTWKRVLFGKKMVFIQTLGGGFIFFYFYPYLEKRSNLTNMFQMGWNHQLEHVYGLPFIMCERMAFIQNR